jgi:hypothetical protein
MITDVVSKVDNAFSALIVPVVGISIPFMIQRYMIRLHRQ